MKVKFLGFESIVHISGRRFEPGEIYDMSYEEWIQVQGNEIFKLMVDGVSSIEVPKIRGRRKKELDMEIREEIKEKSEDVKRGDEE